MAVCAVELHPADILVRKMSCSTTGLLAPIQQCQVNVDTGMKENTQCGSCWLRSLHCLCSEQCLHRVCLGCSQTTLLPKILRQCLRYTVLCTHAPPLACCAVLVAAGFTSVIEKQQLASLCEEGGDTGLPEWEDFKEDLLAGKISFPSIRVPFLFAGTVLDAPAAAVYQLKKAGEVVGVAVSSEAAE